MSEELVREARPTTAVAHQRPIVLAGWPDSAVIGAKELLRQIAPEPTARRDSELPSHNRFFERVVVPRHPADVHAIRDALQTDEQALLVIVVEDLEAYLARALPARSRVDPALVGDWRIAVDRLLAVASSDAKNNKVVSLTDMTAAPAEFSNYLSELVEERLAYTGEVEKPYRGQWDDFYLLLARQLAGDHDEAYLLNVELAERKARFLSPQAESAGVPDWSAVLCDVQALRTENRALLEMLHRVQLEYEGSMAALSAAEDEQRQLRSEVSTAHQERDRANCAVEQERAAHKKASSRATALEAQLTLVRASTSWRLTAPLRALVGSVRGPR